MILRSLCNTCLSPFELLFEPKDVALLNELRDEEALCQCPTGCGGKINLFHDEQISTLRGLREPQVLRAVELYKAVRGGGLPEEIPTDPDVVLALLKAHPVADAVVEKEGRAVYLREMRLADGSTLHLMSGLRGARVYKITKKEDGK